MWCRIASQLIEKLENVLVVVVVVVVVVAVIATEVAALLELHLKAD